MFGSPQNGRTYEAKDTAQRRGHVTLLRSSHCRIFVCLLALLGIIIESGPGQDSMAIARERQERALNATRPASPVRTTVPGVQDALRDASVRLRPAIVLLGRPDGSCGTGFVVSRANRLVVSAAHVADMHLRKGQFWLC
jgi:hypothetical protein